MAAFTLNQSSFLNNWSPAFCRPSPQRSRHSVSVVVGALGSRGGDKKKVNKVLMESTMKEIADGASAVDLDSKPTVGDVEDQATEDHPVTPWTFSVAR